MKATLSTRGWFFSFYVVLGQCLHSCCPYKTPEMPAEGDYRIVRSREIPFDISSIVVADNELTVTYLDEDDQEQWVTYLVVAR